MRYSIRWDMERTSVAILIATMAIIAAEARAQNEVARARGILEASAKAYKSVPALRDTLSYVVSAPGSEQETKTQEYGFGPGPSVFVKNALLEAVAVDEKFYLTQSDVTTDMSARVTIAIRERSPKCGWRQLSFRTATASDA